MIKALLIWVSILIASAACGQTDRVKLQKPPLDSLTGKICYSEDVSVLSVDFITSKEELFSRALAWFKHDFSTADRYQVRVEDKEAGKIVAKDLIYYSYGPGSGDPYSLRERLERRHDYIEYTISIHVKDGGYQFFMTDFNPLLEKVGSNIADHGFPQNLINQPTVGVDSVKLKIGDYNLTYEMIARTAEYRITSLKKAMADETW